MTPKAIASPVCLAIQMRMRRFHVGITIRVSSVRVPPLNVGASNKPYFEACLDQMYHIDLVRVDDVLTK